MPHVTRRRHYRFVLPLLLAVLCAGCELLEAMEDKPGMKGTWVLYGVNGDTWETGQGWHIGSTTLKEGFLVFSHDDAGWVLGSVDVIPATGPERWERVGGTFTHTSRSSVAGTVDLGSLYGSFQGSVWFGGAQSYDLVEFDASFLYGSAGKGTVLTFRR